MAVEKYVLESEEHNHIHPIKEWAVGIDLEVGDFVHYLKDTFQVLVAHTTAAEDAPTNTDIVLEPAGAATYSLVTTVGAVGDDTSVPSEQGVREAITAEEVARDAAVAALSTIMYALPIEVQRVHAVAESAATDFVEPVFTAPTGTAWTVTEAGVIPDTTAFGQATNNAVLTLQNRGTEGTSTAAIASKTFDAACTIRKKNSLGAIASPTVSSDEVLAFVKTHNGSGQAVSVGLFYVVLTRVAP